MPKAVATTETRSACVPLEHPRRSNPAWPRCNCRTVDWLASCTSRWPMAARDLFAAAAGATGEPAVYVSAMEEGRAWDAYVARRPEATLYHLFGWKTVAEEAYGLRTPFLVARDGSGGAIRGILPLIRVPRPFTQYLTTGLFGA